MQRDTLAKITENIRVSAIFIIGGGATLLVALLMVMIIRAQINNGQPTGSLTATLIGCGMVGAVFIWLCCLTANQAFSFWKTTQLKKAIQLSAAMQQLCLHTHFEKIEAIKVHSIRIFKSKNILPQECIENVLCQEVSTFLSPLFFNVDRLSAFGSPYYCCDFEQIEQIIAENRKKWSTAPESLKGQTVDVLALERRVADLLEKNKDISGKFTAANARESKAKQQIEEASTHMKILVELTCHVTNEYKPPRKITTREIKAKYIAIGKLCGITEAPGEYVEIFRKTMPKELINWGGAPNQGVEQDQT